MSYSDKSLSFALSVMIKDFQKDDRNSDNNVLSHFFNLSISSKNEYRTFLVKKTERLASALYVITGFIEHTDPVRVKIRSSALDLISKASQGDLTSPETFGASCAEIAALVETAKSAGFVSQMNARLICDEYASLATFVEENRKVISDSGQQVEKDRIPLPKGLKGQNIIKSPLSNLKDSNQNTNKRQDNRKSYILSLLSKKDKVSIKDISSEISGYSEKTIQRDLLALVKDGVLIKEGERRWSVYRKAQTASGGLVGADEE